MEEKNELSDIMLDKNSDKSSKMKKILLLSIALIILFLLILAGMRLFNKPEVKKNKFNIVLPPEPTTKMDKQQNKDELFKQVPIIEENSTKTDNFNAMVEKLKQKEQQQEATKQKIQEETKKPTKAQNSVKKALSTVKKVKPNTKTKVKKRAVYVQVGVTFKEKPSKKYLKKITKAGYKYTLYNIKIAGKNATKILIGPYSSRKSAIKSIGKIKKEINKAAFIYVVK